jgi:glycosyltransferase involved in cell wall biosynthesis
MDTPADPLPLDGTGHTEPPERPAQPRLSVVVPFLNEAPNLPALVAELEQALGALNLPYELVLVDDGSRDGSLEVLHTTLQRHRGLNATVISLSRNFGKEAALTAGMEAATGDVVVPLDADLQDPPELIGALLEEWRAGDRKSVV